MRWKQRLLELFQANLAFTLLGLRICIVQRMSERKTDGQEPRTVFVFAVRWYPSLESVFTAMANHAIPNTIFVVMTFCKQHIDDFRNQEAIGFCIWSQLRRLLLLWKETRYCKSYGAFQSTKFSSLALRQLEQLLLFSREVQAIEVVCYFSASFSSSKFVSQFQQNFLLRHQILHVRVLFSSSWFAPVPRADRGSSTSQELRCWLVNNMFANNFLRLKSKSRNRDRNPLKPPKVLVETGNKRFPTNGRGRTREQN